MSHILITGGTGSLGQALTTSLLGNKHFITIYSRDELKQYEMKQAFNNHSRIEFIIGDVRNKDRLMEACAGVTTVIHAAAMKQIPICEANPYEAIQTNVEGTKNVLDACIAKGVNRAILISTDKAVYPINLYGATKLAAEKLFLNHRFPRIPECCVIRYGNVLGSRGSVVDVFKKQKETGTITITHEEMTRFWLTMGHAVYLVAKQVDTSYPKQLVIPKLPSMKIVDLAQAIAPECTIKITGVRPGEKLHESLEYGYSSDKNTDWITVEQMRELLK